MGKDGKSVILCYHKVGSEREFGRRLNVDPATLESHARFFRRRQWVSVLASEFLPFHPKQVSFTFDDGFEGALHYAPGILKRHGSVGTFYAVTDQVGLTSDWEGEEKWGLADWPTLVRVAKEGHEIGAHSRRHPRLDRIGLEDAREEILGSIAAIREHGIQCGSFCYPYGGYRNEFREWLAEVGIVNAVSLRKGPATGADEAVPYALPRIVIGFGDTLPLLLYRVFIRPHLP